MLAIGLKRAGAHPVDIGMRSAEAADVYRPHIIGRRAIGHPFGQRHPGTAPRSDTKGIESGTDEHIGHLWRLTEDKITIRRETFRAVDQLFNANALQFWHPRQGHLNQLFKMIKI